MSWQVKAVFIMKYLGLTKVWSRKSVTKMSNKEILFHFLFMFCYGC